MKSTKKKKKWGFNRTVVEARSAMQKTGKEEERRKEVLEGGGETTKKGVPSIKRKRRGRGSTSLSSKKGFKN